MTDQAIEGYLCSCGFKTGNVNKFRGHFARFSMKADEHQSRGRVNYETGEVTMPPAKERTKDQWNEAKYGEYGKEGKLEGSKEAKLGSKKGLETPFEAVAGAMTIKMIPRAYTMDYSPILRMAQDAAIKFWGWRPEMPLVNFIDTVLYLYFKEKGITLVGYIIDETEEERVEREAAVQAFNKKPEEVPA